MTDQKREPVPLGPYKKRTAEQRRRAARITPERIANAKAFVTGMRIPGWYFVGKRVVKLSAAQCKKFWLAQKKP